VGSALETFEIGEGITGEEFRLMAKTKIEWTAATWNPVTGCTKVSAGCQHCYAERMATRLQLMGQRNYSNGFELTLQPDMLNRPLAWRAPQMIFVNSMSDLFHDDVPLEFIREVFSVMKQADWHTFQVLTKRSERLAELASVLEWPANVWMGVSVENDRYLPRIDDLRRVPAAVRFLSLEPLLGPLHDLDLTGIDWVIVGGESGPGARPMEPEWVKGIRDRCVRAGVPFFFKQWGGTNKKKTGRVLDGRTWVEIPESPAVRN
jgi:protein gp37